MKFKTTLNIKWNRYPPVFVLPHRAELDFAAFAFSSWRQMSGSSFMVCVHLYWRRTRFNSDDDSQPKARKTCQCLLHTSRCYWRQWWWSRRRRWYGTDPAFTRSSKPDDEKWSGSHDAGNPNQIAPDDFKSWFGSQTKADDELSTTMLKTSEEKRLQEEIAWSPF